VEDVGPPWAEPQKKSLRAAEQERPDVVQARCAWEAKQACLEADHLVFVDETWASTKMSPIRGRSPKGTRCIGHAPYGHWRTTTFVCALRTQGLIAPLVFDGPINGDAFRAWVEQALVPPLQPGDIDGAGAQRRYLPPYSPDYNPIEQVFAKLKTLLRKTAARTVNALWSALGCLLDQFAPDECKRYIWHSGYGRPG
jgi:transposase